MTVLYRKYRPQTFVEISGQEHVKSTLAQEVASGTLAHSYLFTGPRGVGKTSIARIFAKAVNCAARKKGSGEPCGKCASCEEITEGRSLDVIEMDAASHTGVDNVREQIVERARFAPTKSKYKVYIIDEVHMLSTSAFNALLKTLEEPPAHIIFILATTELHKLPATIVSRCQRFDFRRISREDLTARLQELAKKEGVEVAPEVVEAIYGRSEGCLRDAESLLSQLLSLGGKTITVETAALVLPAAASERILGLAQAIVTRDAVEALIRWEALARDGADLMRAVADLTEVIRASALGTLRGHTPTLTIAPGEAATLLKRLTTLRDEMKRADIPELPFEVMILEWAATSDVKFSPSVRGGQGESVIRIEPTPPASGHLPLQGREKPPELKTEPQRESVGVSIANVRARWTEVLRKAQDRHHSLPYMLGATEILSCENGELTLGFQYAMYRDRLNDIRHRGHLEAALQEVFGVKLYVKAVLVAQKVDGTVEEAPHLAITPNATLPDGFAELAKEFGGTFG